MDYAVVVGVLQGVAHFLGDPERGVQRKLPLTSESVAERLAFDVGHDVPDQTRCLTGVVKGQDMGVLQRGGDLDLAEEPLAAERGGELRLEDLERDQPVMLEVFGQEDDGHAAVAELALDPVAIADGCGELLEEGHDQAGSSRRESAAGSGKPLQRESARPPDRVAGTVVCGSLVLRWC
jgi:hypothetical protein